MLNPDEEKALAELFTHHKPTEEQTASLGALREAARIFASAIVVNCPRSADRAAALRKLRECVMTSNASIVLPALPAL